MSRRAFSLATLVALAIIALQALLSTPAGAQGLGTYKEAVKKAENAANATNRNTSAQTGQELRVVGKQAQTGKPSGPASPSGAKGAAEQTTAEAPTGTAVVPQVTREIFTYEPEARRDPFYSLILTEDLRPLLSDLRLVGILYAGAGGKSVAIMRDIQTNAQYRVNTGMTLGRMRVTQIKQRSVIFLLDEFGLSRQDSLFLADTTRMRIR